MSKRQEWHRENREKSLRSSAYARRHLRHKNTRIHRNLHAALVDLGLSPETEYEVRFYAIDEAFPDVKVAVEVDGCYWHGCGICGFLPRPGIRRRDRAKDTYLRNRGWEVLRFPGHRIQRDVVVCAREVLETVKRRRGGS